MNTNAKVWAGYDEVTVSDRLYLHNQIAQLTRGQVFHQAAILRAATHWESFPDSYTLEQIAAARELHIAGRAGSGTVVWANAMRKVRDIMVTAVAQ